MFAWVATWIHAADAPAPEGNPATGKVFFQQEFPTVHGNGRSCATCHVPDEAFQLAPGSVEARYQALQERRLADPDEDMVRHYQLVFEATRRVIPDFVPWPLRPEPITDAQFAPLIVYLKKI